ncbi:MAG: GtrA family protein [Tenericutes bacterium]|nr:GtrA family protein [Mycoplasmatota bacterium]
MKKVVKLYKKYEEIINYLIFGVLTTLVSLITKWGLLYTILDPTNSLELQISIIISWICSVSFAYVTNRLYVFKSENKGILKEIVSFFGARLLTLGIEMFIMWFFVTYLKMNSDIMVFIWTIATQFIIIVLNYIFSKLIVFRKKS